MCREIRKLGMPAWLPTYETAGGKIGVAFPRYAFFQADLGSDRWRAIYRTAGVVTILGARGSQPSSIADDEMRQIWSLCADDGVIYRRKARRIARGDVVRVTAGTFSGQEGICEWSSKRRVALLLSLFGRTVRAHVSIKHARPA